MMLEEARQAYKAQYLNQKGVVGVCSKAKVDPVTLAVDEWLMIYVSTVHIFALMPKEFMGFRCEYIIAHGDYAYGCD